MSPHDVTPFQGFSTTNHIPRAIALGWYGAPFQGFPTTRRFSGKIAPEWYMAPVQSHSKRPDRTDTFGTSFYNSMSCATADTPKGFDIRAQGRCPGTAVDIWSEP